MSHRLLAVIHVSLAAMIAGCSSGVAETPPMTAETEARLAAGAIAQACRVECARLTVYIRDELITVGSLAGQTEQMPEITRDAINQEMGEVRFVDRTEASELVADDGLVDGGKGVLVSVGPLAELAPNVVGFEVGMTTAHDGFYGQTIQFQWTGDAWEPATSEETGVTVTSSVS